MRDDHAAPITDDGGTGEGGFDADVTPPIFTGNATSVAPAMASRRGYANLGLQLPPITAAGDVGGIGGDDDYYYDNGEVVAAAAAPKGRGFVAAAGRRKNKMSYIGLDGGCGGSTAEMSDSGGEEEGAVAATKGADNTSGRLAIFGLLNLGYVVLQLAGAMAFSSLALMSDGFHNLSDVAAIGMAMYIHWLQRRKCPENRDGGTDVLPYGYKRAEVIGGLMNSVALVALSAYIILSAIPRLFEPTEVQEGWLYILLAFGGVVINLVGVLFFLFSGEEGQCHHGGGFLAAHSHSHEHGHEAPAGLDALGLLTLVDPYDVPPTATSSSPSDGGASGCDDDEVSVVLAGSDPIGRVNLAKANAARPRGAFLLGGHGIKGAGKEEEEAGGWVGGEGAEGGVSGGCTAAASGVSHHHAEGNVSLHAHAYSRSLSHSHSHSHSHGGHSCGHGQQPDGTGGRRGADGDAGLTAAAAMVPPLSKDGRASGHAKGYVCNGGHHGGAAIGGDGDGEDDGDCDDGERHGHEQHGRGHHADLDSGGGGGCGCSHGSGHEREHGGHEHGAESEGGCDGQDHGHAHGHGHGGKSMNVMAVLVHAITDAVSSGVVCAQGVVAYSFGRRGVDWTDYLDPLTSIALSVFVVYCALPVVKECAHVLLEGTPRSADLPRLRRELLEVRGVSSIHRLSITQLNSEEPFVASVTIVAAAAGTGGAGAAAGKGGDCGSRGEAGQGAAGVTASVAKSVKRILAGHNIGRNTVEVMFLPSDGASAAAAAELEGTAARGGAGLGGFNGRGVLLAAVGGDCRHDNAERGQHIGGGAGRGGEGEAVITAQGGHSHGHGHGQCSGHEHEHRHASTAGDFL